jgi:hypothetical protein
VNQLFIVCAEEEKNPDPNNNFLHAHSPIHTMHNFQTLSFFYLKTIFLSLLHCFLQIFDWELEERKNNTQHANKKIVLQKVGYTQEIYFQVRYALS